MAGSGQAVRLSALTLGRLMLVLLTGMAGLMFAEALFWLHGNGRPLFANSILQAVAGVAAAWALARWQHSSEWPAESCSSRRWCCSSA